MKGIAALVAALALLALAAPATAGRWSRVSAFQHEGNAGSPSVDVNARGDAAIAWTEAATPTGPLRVMVATARAGRGFGRPVAVSGSLAGEPPLARIDDRGNVAVGWTYFDGTFIGEPELREEDCCVRVAGALRLAGRSSFGPPRTLSPAGEDSTVFDVAAGPRGGGFVWTNGYDLGDTLYANFGNSDGSIGGRKRILSSGREYFETASILIRRDGSASLAVTRGDGVLFERARSAGGRLGKARVIARQGSGYDLGFRGADAAGNEFVTFGAFGPTRWSARSRGGFFGVRRTLPRRLVGRPGIAPDGGVLVAGSDRPNTSVYAAFKRRRGGFSRSRRLATHRSKLSASPRAAAGNGGRGVVVWSLEPDSFGTAWIYARPLRAGGVPGGGTRRLALSTRGRADERNPAADASASGRVLVAWGEGGRVAFARYTP